MSLQQGLLGIWNRHLFAKKITVNSISGNVKNKLLIPRGEV